MNMLFDLFVLSLVMLGVSVLGVIYCFFENLSDRKEADKRQREQAKAEKFRQAKENARKTNIMYEADMWYYYHSIIDKK